MRYLNLLLSILIVITGYGCKHNRHLIIRSGKDVNVTSAMVVSAHPLASEAGAKIMAAGGNAVDAAVAVEFALAVCYPAAGNIGGGGFMVIRLADGTVSSLDYREKAPAAAGRDMYLDEKGNVVEGLSLNSHLSAGVPGTVDGLLNAHKRYGKLPLKDVIQPAIDMAVRGFPVTERQARSLNEMKQVFLDRNDYRVAFISDDPWRTGDTLLQPELGVSLERIRDNGREGFYEGPTAGMIIAECRKGNGIITAEDLLSYKSTWRNPIVSEYRKFRVISMPPPSSGGIGLIQMLKMIELSGKSTGAFHDPDEIHLMAEVERRAFADRAHYLGDPDFLEIPVSHLVSSGYLYERIMDFLPDTVTPSSVIKYGSIVSHESEETTHYSVVDQFGNAVAGTTTLNNSYGTAIVVKGAGFILNDEMDDFSLKPGTPNMYGLVGGEANAIAPGKRMLSSMTPAILEKDGKLFMVVGSPGGSTIITSVFQVIRNVVDYGMKIADAVAAPRFHHQWLPDVISYEEDSFDSLTISYLRNLGHTLTPRGAIGRVDAILIEPDGSLSGGADPRGDDTAVGW